jgi:CRISPR-associated endonuclease Csn1
LVTLSAFEANQPADTSNNNRPHPAAKRIARIHINDMCALGTGTDTNIFRVRKIDNSGIVHIDPHNEANVAARIGKGEMRDIKKSAEQLRTEGFRKIGVNEIGDVLDHGPLAKIR